MPEPKNYNKKSIIRIINESILLINLQINISTVIRDENYKLQNSIFIEEK